DMEEAAKKLGEEFAYKVINGRYTEEGKENEKYAKRDSEADSDFCNESPCENNQDSDESEEEKVKRILTESRLVDLQLIAKRKRRHKTENVLKMIKLAHRIGKGDLSVNLKE